MSTQTESLKLALEALDNLMYWDNGKPDYDEAREAIAAIKEALAQPEQEPASVTYKEVADTMNALWYGTVEQEQMAKVLENKKLYTTPQQRKPLTDEQMNALWFDTNKQHGSGIWRFARAIEAAHGIKE